MIELGAELHSIWQFIEMVLTVLFVTGAGFGWLVAWGYELATKRRS